MFKALQIALVLTALDRASAPVKTVSNAVGGIGKAADVVVAKLVKVQARLKGMAESSEQFGRHTAMTGTLTVAAVNRVMQPYEELEDATTRMELAYTNAQGKASRYFEAIKRQTVDLGNQLPGTTKDFTQLATSLKEAAISERMIANGGLKAAGYLRTIFKENDSKKVAEVVAGSLHAFNLADDSLVKYIDIMQRAHYAFGMTLEDFKYGLPYIARSYGLLNPKGGLGAAKNQTIMMGMLKQGGMEGSMIGESIGSFYTQLATRETRLQFGMGRRGLLTLAGDILKKYGADLEIFNKKGAYVGDEALVKKIWRLKELGATAQEISIIGNSLAGAVGSTIFTKLYQQGPEGWKKADKALQDQLDLTEKIARLLKTLTNIKESALGTITNLAATVGSALGPSLKSFFDRLNSITSRLQVFFDTQQKGNTIVWRLTKFILLTVLALGALGVVLGVGALAFGAIAKPIIVLISLFGALRNAILFFRAAQTVGMFGEIITGPSQAAIQLAKMKTALAGATYAAKAFFLTTAGTALVVVAAIGAVTAAIYQLVKHWDTLKQPGLLKDLWGWVSGKDPEKEYDRPSDLRKKQMVSNLGNTLSSPASKFKPALPNARHANPVAVTGAVMPEPPPAVPTQKQMMSGTMPPVQPVRALAMPAAKGGAVHTTFAPQITVQGGNPDQVKSAVNQALQVSFAEFERLMQRYERERQRKGYN